MAALYLTGEQIANVMSDDMEDAAIALVAFGRDLVFFTSETEKLVRYLKRQDSPETLCQLQSLFARALAD